MAKHKSQAVIPSTRKLRSQAGSLAGPMFGDVTLLSSASGSAYSTLEELPIEILEMILLYLDPSDIANIMRSCRHFLDIIQQSTSIKKSFWIYDLKPGTSDAVSGADEIYDANYPFEYRIWNPIQSSVANGGYWQITLQASKDMANSSGAATKHACMIFAFSPTMPEVREHMSLNIAGEFATRLPNAKVKPLTKTEDVMQAGFILNSTRLIRSDLPLLVLLHSPTDWWYWKECNGRGVEILIDGGMSVGEILVVIDNKLAELRKSYWKGAKGGS